VSTATPTMSLSIAEKLLAEFETQAPITRRFLERLPEEKLTWKPHDRSMSAGQLALHLASVPAGVVRLAQDNPAQAPGAFDHPHPASRQEVLARFDECIVLVRESLRQFDDQAMNETWHLMIGDQEILAQPRAEFLRDTMLSHWYQHRGQFSVYLRLLNIPVPASWGPSGDEPPLFLQRTQAD
jgi:uncharacterized damage-inducible protein DinB